MSQPIQSYMPVDPFTGIAAGGTPSGKQSIVSSGTYDKVSINGQEHLAQNKISEIQQNSDSSLRQSAVHAERVADAQMLNMADEQQKMIRATVNQANDAISAQRISPDELLMQNVGIMMSANPGSSPMTESLAAKMSDPEGRNPLKDVAMMEALAERMKRTA